MPYLTLVRSGDYGKRVRLISYFAGSDEPGKAVRPISYSVMND